jgi:hypothetical protein
LRNVTRLTLLAARATRPGLRIVVDNL